MSKMQFNTFSFVDKIIPNIMERYNKSIGINADGGKKEYEYAIINRNNDCFQMQKLIYVDVVMDSKRKLSLVIKVMQPGLEYYEYHYENEIRMYEDIIPLMGLGSKRMFPRCLFARTRGNSMEPPMLALENLMADGYRINKNKLFLSLDEILLALKTLGEFHGHGYVFKLKSRETFDKLVSKIQPTYFANDDKSYPIFKASQSQASVRVLRRFLEMNEKEECKENLVMKARALLKRITKGNAIAFMKKFMEPREPLAVLVHGDYNKNNIMFSYADDTQNKPTDCIVIDLQTIGLSSPMADFTFLLFMNMRADEERPWDQLWDAYHTTLVTTLCKELGIQNTELPQFFSLSSFKEEFNRYCLCTYMRILAFLNIGYVIGMDVVLPLDDVYDEMKRIHQEDETLKVEFDDYLYNKLCDEFETDEFRVVMDSLTVEVLSFYNDSVLLE